jgi:hypothetical protein
VEVDQRLLLGTGHGWLLFVSLYGRNAGFLLSLPQVNPMPLGNLLFVEAS